MSARHNEVSNYQPARHPPSALWADMTRLILATILMLGLTALNMPRAIAAHDIDINTTATLTGEQPKTNLQLVVLEAPGCTYCNLFRRYVVPAYETSPKSRSVPIKFIDLNDKAYDELGLDSPVDMVPTTVLLQNNREVGRIPGYLGPENFFHAFNHLMARVN